MSDDLPLIELHSRHLTSGYAPRTIRLSTHHDDTLFVGCKDDSLWKLCNDDCVELVARETENPRGGIRAICEIDADQLLTGYHDGSLGLIQWRKSPRMPVSFSSGSLPDQLGPVRCLITVAKNHFLASFRDGGCWLLSLPQTQKVNASQAVSFTAEPIGPKHLRTVRFALPLAGASNGVIWILITETGDIWTWNGDLEEGAARSAVKAEEPWHLGERPGVINDFALQSCESPAVPIGQGAECIYLATDLGVYLLAATSESKLVTCRLSLSGLGTMCTALTYVESGTRSYLWAADLQGKCHLFWADPYESGKEASRPRTTPIPESSIDSEDQVRGAWLNFRSLRTFTYEARAQLAYLWRQTDQRLQLAQAGHEDHVTLVSLDEKPREARRIAPRQQLRRILLGVRMDSSPSQASAMDLEVFINEAKAFLIDRERRRRGDQANHTQTRVTDELFPSSCSWHAAIAELFEDAVEDEETRSLLPEILTVASADLAAAFLLEQATREPDSLHKVVQLWTLALLGVAHRSGLGDEAYLAIVRWLRTRLDQSCSLLKKNAKGINLGEFERRREALTRAIEDSIRFVRKWGIYGEDHRRRNNLIRPLRVLRKQEDSGGPLEGGLRLDRLTQEALLFQRSVDEITFEISGRLRGRTAWDLRVATLSRTVRMVAVSWIWGGVELHVLETNDQATTLSPRNAIIPEMRFDSATGRFQVDWNVKSLIERQKHKIRPFKYLYSRAILLSSIEGRYYLLTAPALEPDSSQQEKVHLWLLGLDDPESIVIGEKGSATLPARESIYSLLEIAPGWILAGLRGHTGVPAIAIFRVFLRDGAPTIERTRYQHLSALAIDDRQGLGDDPLSVRRNRIWSLAKMADHSSSSTDSGQVTRVAVGCEDGEIFVLELGFHAGGSKSLNVSAQRIARMSSSVFALAYRNVVEGRKSYDRIFAGGEDGAIVAWQAHREYGTVGTRGTSSQGYASLWATSEDGTIARIHLLSRGTDPQVLAVTRQGRSILFDDRAAIEEPEEPTSPRRIQLPGCRHGRSSLRGAAFASVLFETWPDPSDYERVAVLLSATDEGTLRLVSLHAPPLTKQRHKWFLAIFRQWTSIVREAHQLRLADGVLSAAPNLLLLLVRWLLDPAVEDSALAAQLPSHHRPDSEGFSRWWLSRTIRPMLILRLQWQEFETALAENRFREAEEHALEIGKALETALRRAWQLDDVGLFKETLAVVLKRANFLLFESVRSHQEQSSASQWLQKKNQVKNLYAQVVDGIERTLPRWLGADGQKEARVRMTVAKHLVDGDTFWQVAREAARESLGKSNEKPFLEILGKRIEAVRQLVFKSNPLVNLEALRAANLSLLRLCRRLLTFRQELWIGGWRPPLRDQFAETEVPWTIFEKYFERMISAAARAFGSRPELDDALAHEYSRTFALAICACPSATMRIANRMTEMQLVSDTNKPEDLSHRVLRQLEVLDQIGLKVYRQQKLLFRTASQPEQALESDLNPASRVVKDLFKVAPEEMAQSPDCKATTEQVGVENGEDLYCLCRLYTVVDWFKELGIKLSTDAQDIDLGDLDDYREKLTEPTLERLYRESSSFWHHAITQLQDRLDWRDSKGSTIRPAMVLYSFRIAVWAKDMLADIDRRYRRMELYQPEYPIFREVLARLLRAAESFPRSAAVQKNIVRGVLRHHMLSGLDEHVLELEEIAHTLAPRAERFGYALDGRGTDSASSVEKKFAEYLQRHARNAESIPKNLRTLLALLESPDDRKAPAKPKPRKLLGDLLGRFADREEVPWDIRSVADVDADLDDRELRFLTLTLKELDHNDRKYAQLSPQERQVPPRVFRHRFDPPEAIRIRFLFNDPDNTNVSRLQEIRKASLQTPIRPQEDRRVASTGTGLYLANFAAAAVRWRLTIEESSPRRSNPSKPYLCIFVLKKWEQ